MDKLSRRDVPHELISLPGAGHGLGGVHEGIVADLHRRGLAFLRQHIGSP